VEVHEQMATAAQVEQVTSAAAAAAVVHQELDSHLEQAEQAAVVA
jgi:hypothetical protein